MRFVAVLTMAIAALAARSACAAMPSGNDLVHVTLLADVDSVKPGKPFNLALHFKIKPGWHLYWKYPGDAGLPPTAQWKLPDGFTAGELRFPIPTRYEQAGDIVAYGYQDELLLTTTVTPPNNLPDGRKIILAADVSWLVCEKVCLPGKASVSIDLPVGEAKPANQETFAAWEPRLPSDPRQLKDFVEETGQWKGEKSGAFVQFSNPMKDVVWFANPPRGSGVENLHETSQTNLPGNTSTVMFDLVPAPKSDVPMSFLVVFTDPEGKRRGVEFTVNLTPPAADKK